MASSMAAPMPLRNGGCVTKKPALAKAQQWHRRLSSTPGFVGGSGSAVGDARSSAAMRGGVIPSPSTRKSVRGHQRRRHALVARAAAADGAAPTPEAMAARRQVLATINVGKLRTICAGMNVAGGGEGKKSELIDRLLTREFGAAAVREFDGGRQPGAPDEDDDGTEETTPIPSIGASADAAPTVVAAPSAPAPPAPPPPQQTPAAAPTAADPTAAPWSTTSRNPWAGRCLTADDEQPSHAAERVPGAGSAGTAIVHGRSDREGGGEGGNPADPEARGRARRKGAGL